MLWELFLCVFIGSSFGIYVPGGNLSEKPLSSLGIKTIGWQDTGGGSLVIHQNYSGVKLQQHTDAKNLQQVYEDNASRDHGQQLMEQWIDQFDDQTQDVRKDQLVENFDQGASSSNNRVLQFSKSAPVGSQNRLYQPPEKYTSANRQGKQFNPQNFYSGNRPLATNNLDQTVYSACPTGQTGQFIYDQSCKQFLNCYKGRGHAQNCAPGTLFNPETLECDYAEKVECVSSVNNLRLDLGPISEKQQASCPKGFSGIIPHYTDCAKFINCANGVEYMMDCAPGTLFNIRSNNCDYPHKAECVGAKDRSGQNNQNPNQNGWNGQNQNVRQSSLNSQSGQNAGQNSQHNSWNGQNVAQNSWNAQGGQNAGQNSWNGQNAGQNSWNGQNAGQNSWNGQNAAQNSWNARQNENYQTGSQQNHRQGHKYEQTGGNQWQGVGANRGSSVKGQSSYQKGSTGSWNQGVGTETAWNQNSGGGQFNHNQGTGWNQNSGSSQSTHNQGNSGWNQNASGSQSTPNQGQSGTGWNQNAGSSQTTHNQESSGSGWNQNSGGSQFNHNQGNAGTAWNKNTGWNQNQFVGSHGVGQNTTQHSEKIVQSGRPKCPNGFTGLTPHPFDCKKFLNCANGATYIQDCGPGTVYNPAINACDHPKPGMCGENARGSQNDLQQGGAKWNQQYNQQQGATNWNTNQGTTHSHANKQNQGSSNWNSNGQNQGSSNWNTNGQNQGATNWNSHGQNQGSTNWNSNGQNQGSTSWNTNGQNEGTTGRNPASTNWNTNGQNQGSSGHNQGSTSWNTNGQNQGTSGQNKGSSGWNTNGQNQGSSGSNWSGVNQQKGSTNNHQAKGTGEQSGSSNWNANNQYHGSAFGGTQAWNQAANSNTNQQKTNWGQTGGSINQDGHTQGRQNRTYTVNEPHSSTWNQQGQNWPGQQTTTPATWSGQGVKTQPGTGMNQIGAGQKLPWGQKPPHHEQTHSQNLDVVENLTNRPPNWALNKKPTAVEGTIEQKSVSGKTWPPPFPSTDLNADYVFEEDDLDVMLESELFKPDAGYNSHDAQKDWCDAKGFECGNKRCVAPSAVCDGKKDCPNGRDEIDCDDAFSRFSPTRQTKLAVREVEKTANITAKWCAKTCVEKERLNCKSFNYRKHDGTCFLLDTNVGKTGALIILPNYDYYENGAYQVSCENGYLCNNKKCISRTQLCDGANDCTDWADEKGCSAEKFGYKIELAGSEQKNAGRIEIKAFGKHGYICDDMFGLRNADVACRELGFPLGALEVRGNSAFAADLVENDTFYMMDDVSCLGNETTLRDCDFGGWGVHNCRPQEIVGVICKTPLETCPPEHWKCKTGNECLQMSFVCDGVYDCTDKSDEEDDFCELPIDVRLANGTSKMNGRLEVRYHGIWGTVCDDDFNDEAAKVVCKQLGFRGSGVVRKGGFYGAGSGPIWLDQVFCQGNETRLSGCIHWDWGEHNCDHSEDVGVVCSHQEIIEEHPRHLHEEEEIEYLPEKCGFRSDAMFLNEDSDVHFRVVQGSVAKAGEYPWQASIRVKGKTKSTHWCGAVVISKRYVLTAAHCLNGYIKDAYTVFAGDYNVDVDEGTEQEAFIEDFEIHEYFRSGSKMNNDIAVVKLKSPGFKFTDAVQAICLPDAAFEADRNANCTISGFGSVESGKARASKNLRAGWIPVQSREICKMPHVYGEAITEGMICAGSLDEGVDACDGDSGGPLACLNDGVFTLFGLTSWGQHCGYANKPGVYVKVAHYRKWIERTMKKM